MGSTGLTEKPHAVCIPYPAQGHITPMLQLTKLLHYKGFHITFVNTEFNHRRLLKSRGPNSLDGLPSFRFETIPDGLPPTDTNATQDVTALCVSTRKNCLAPFRDLLSKLNSLPDSPPVTCIVSNGGMAFTFYAAQELGIPEVIFETPSACGLMCYLQYRPLIEKGLVPLKDASYLTNGYLDTEIDWIPGMRGIRLRDIPSFIRTTDPNDFMLNFLLVEMARVKRASAIILNTFDALEHEVLDGLSTLLPPVYSVGPLHLQLNQIPADNELKSIGSNLWTEEPMCLDWLDSKEPNSVVYVNFGSITVMTAEQLIEFAWGLANSNQTFFWVIRPDLVGGEAAVVPPEFMEETKERGLLASWCPQEQSIGSNLWTEETECLQWLDSKEPNSVVYVNFGSSTVMTSEQLTEFAWGLANSKKAFFWVIRPDLVGEGKSVVVAPEFVEETKERGLLASWCPQEQVLSHPAVGGFLTHSGWNSTLESLCGGVPMICWPFFAEQQTNCRFCCKEWGIGMEIEGDVKRNYVEGLVRKLMEGEEGKEMRKKALEWKKLAKEATIGPNGLSFVGLDKLVNQVLLSPRN
ncbi:PREDICTED: 7-deoxyloganetin glucosyltransferase-like [Prunus mume]|uniref:Glycosyltransferase n=1 Tax=Prunus mume TaxID=102107 RepID=A0ABM0N4L4_PRUMU|nr:PREDICTED: 7-deoxyloganetin glucosyltransferase-like [Prunus mume]